MLGPDYEPEYTSCGMILSWVYPGASLISLRYKHVIFNVLEKLSLQFSGFTHLFGGYKYLILCYNTSTVIKDFVGC